MPPRSGLHSWWQPSHWLEIDVGVDVDDEPVLGERQAVHVRPDGRAGKAVGTVAAQHIAGLHALLTAAHPVQEAHPHPTLLVLGDRGDLHVAVDGDLRVALDVGAEHGFQLRLVEHVHLRESVGGADLCTARDLAEHPHLRVDQPKTVPWPAMGGELLADTQPGQDAKHLVVGVHRPRQRVDGLVAVQHQGFDAVLAQQCRGGDAGRAGTDDHNRNEFRQAVLLRGHLYTTTLRWTPRSMAPSSVAMLASTTSPSCR